MTRLDGMSSKDEAEALARELRSKTTMPLAWIAARLNVGSRGHPSSASDYLVYLFRAAPTVREEAEESLCLFSATRPMVFHG